MAEFLAGHLQKEKGNIAIRTTIGALPKDST